MLNTLNTLCERCQRFDIQSFGRDKFEHRGIRLTEIISSSEHCSFCSYVLEWLQKEYTGFNLARSVTFIQTCDWRSNLPRWLLNWYRSKFHLAECSWVNLSLAPGTAKAGHGLNIAKIKVGLGSYGKQSKSSRIAFDVAADPGTPAANSGDVTGSLLVGNPWNANALEFVRSWHEKCIRSHVGCRETMSGTKIQDVKLPTRCIETSWRGTDPDTRCHVLRETSSVEAQYITLSHRWDDDTKHTKTTKANLDHRLGKCSAASNSGAPCISAISGIPQVFLDTCSLAHDLGVNYVWIDSLCIVQPEGEDKSEFEDWNREAPKMAQYYQHAWATVAASSPNVDGLFRLDRGQRSPRITHLPYRTIDGEVQGSFYLQLARPDELLQEFKTDVEQGKLRRRGWVHQEWTLSRRVIAFTASGFFLHCGTAGPVSSTGDELIGYDDSQAFEFSIKQWLAQKYGQTIPNAGIDDWRRFVRDYSGLSLTKISDDRLIALAGIAEEFGKALRLSESLESQEGGFSCIGGRNEPARYACGAWLRNLSELLWEQAMPGVRHRVSGFPTWSWVSMACDVTLKNGKEVSRAGLGVRWPEFRLVHPEDVAHILEATTIPVDENTRIPMFVTPLQYWPKGFAEYGNENRFVLLTMRGRLLPVYVESGLSKSDADVVGELTSIAPRYPTMTSNALEPDILPPARPYGADLWRGVCLPSNRSKITGWASIEHPDFQSNEPASSSEPIYALLMQRSREKGGFFWIKGPIVERIFYTVLFLKRSTVDTARFERPFERVGVGALYGIDVDSAYRTTPETEISLI